MVSQRQRLARQRCKESHPELFPAAEKGKKSPEKGKKSLGLLSRSAFEIWETPRPQVTKFVSGDDLDDDFVADEKDTVSSTIGSTGTEGGHEKTKKKEGTNIMNFVG